MIYELAHIIKSRVGFLWDICELLNSFVFALQHRNQLSRVGDIVNEGVPIPYTMRILNEDDLPELYAFFERQSDDAFRFFKPHKFDMKSLSKIVGNRAFLTFALFENTVDGNKIIGYAFLRSFCNGSSYRGYMVDEKHRGKGLAKIMGMGMNRVGDYLGLTMYKSIAIANQASMKATQSVCNIEFLKTLDNGDYLIRCMSKSEKNIHKNVIGGGKTNTLEVIGTAIMPQNEFKYAA